MDPDEHNTSVADMWISCDKRQSPLGGAALSHWIMYEFDEVQPIEAIQIWNFNHPLYASYGAKNIKLETSSDGARWATLDTLAMARARGDEAYTGEVFDDFEAFEAKFVLLTILDNYGDRCAGLSEVKFSLGEMTTATADGYLVNQIVASPNPADASFNVDLSTFQATVYGYRLVDILGRVHTYDDISNRGTVSEITIVTAEMPQGQYALQLETDQGTIAKPIVVVHPN